ncbi:MAG: NERD domain-containing protein [Kiritimatiellae bacterium]|nr:NERD domain-containing protein [Kiritimatiellia bacterium]
MAQIHGVAGEWARVKGSVLGLWPLFLGVFAAGFAAATCMVSPALGLSLLVVSLGFIIWSLMAGLRCVERFYRGARGEEKVSGILKSLPSAYHVFNDFAVGRSHVDHVVVGPGGAFAVETKFWRGKVTIEDGHILIDGQLPDRSPVSQVLREASLVKQALSCAGWSGTVTPVLAFASDTFDAHRATLKGVIVMNSCELKASFESDRVVIPPPELERLVGIMESNS